MKVCARKFITLLKRSRTSLQTISLELGVCESKLIRMLNGSQPFDYQQSKRMLEIFGADAMVNVIDWEGMNVRCPV